MNILSWNVNGLRSLIRDNVLNSILELDYDIICLQETKLGSTQLPLELNAGYYNISMNNASKKGYSGTMTLSREVPLTTSKGMDEFYNDTEGRVLTSEFREYFVVNSYFPNSRRDLSRLEMKSDFFKGMSKYLRSLEKRKPVILCGDLNVAHEEIDIARPKENANSPGFTTRERELMTEFLKSGFVDTFRHMKPDEIKYSWWSYMGNARAKNIGWRIDYFVVSSTLTKSIVKADILNEIRGSDHCPVTLTLNTS